MPKKPTTPKPKPQAEKRKVVRSDANNVIWYEDAEILMRLALVSQMMIQESRDFQIAQALSYSIRTAQRDMARVRELWKRQAAKSVDQARLDSIARYRDIIEKTYAEIRKEQQGERKANVSNYFRVIIDAQTRIDALTGANAPQAVDVTTLGKSLVGDPKSLSDAELMQIAKGIKK